MSETKIAGVDGGTTLTKFAWGGPDGLKLRSTANRDIQVILNEMREDGVTHIRSIGTSPPIEVFEEFWVHMPTKGDDEIKTETRLQAKGARHLMQDQGRRLGRHLVVSVGTGTSYTFAIMGMLFRMPVGNALGGGFLEGVRKTMTPIKPLSREEFNHKAMGAHLDIMVGDVLPNHPAKDFVLSNFGGATADSSVESIATSYVRLVATSIIGQIALYGALTKDVVFVGSTLEAYPTLMTILGAWTKKLGKRAHFPEHGSFAGAIGALLG